MNTISKTHFSVVHHIAREIAMGSDLVTSQDRADLAHEVSVLEYWARYDHAAAVKLATLRNPLGVK